MMAEQIQREEQIGRQWRATARKEGHRPKLPDNTAGHCPGRPSDVWVEDMVATLRRLQPATTAELAEVIGVHHDTIAWRLRHLRDRFGMVASRRRPGGASTLREWWLV